MFCLPSPYAYGPLRLTQDTQQLFVSYPAVKPLGLGPTVTSSLFFCPLEAMFCFKHTPTDTPMFCSLKASGIMLVFDSPRIYFLAPVRALWGLCGAFVHYLISCFPKRCGNQFPKQPDNRQPDNPTTRQSDNPTSNNPTTDPTKKNNKPKAGQIATRHT